MTLLYILFDPNDLNKNKLVFEVSRKHLIWIKIFKLHAFFVWLQTEAIWDQFWDVEIDF